MSHEISGTAEIPHESGNWYNYNSVARGKELSQNKAIRNAMRTQNLRGPMKSSKYAVRAAVVRSLMTDPKVHQLGSSPTGVRRARKITQMRQERRRGNIEGIQRQRPYKDKNRGLFSK